MSLASVTIALLQALGVNLGSYSLLITVITDYRRQQCLLIALFSTQIQWCLRPGTRAEHRRQIHIV